MRRWILWCAGLLWLGCAEEPERLVSSTTADDRFKVVMEAADDWVRPGHKLPIKVRVESIVGPLDELWETELKLMANNGSVSPSELRVLFDGAENAAYTVEDSVYERWVTFSAGISDKPSQGEVHALFLGQHAALKIRIISFLDE